MSHLPSDFHGTKSLQEIRANTANFLKKEYEKEEYIEWKKITYISYLRLIERSHKHGRKGMKIEWTPTD